MTDWTTPLESLPPLPEGMSFDEVKQRARAEGILEDMLATGGIAAQFGADDALDGSALPPWAQEVVRSQFA